MKKCRQPQNGKTTSKMETTPKLNMTPKRKTDPKMKRNNEDDIKN